MQSSDHRYCSSEWSYFPHDSCNMETNAPIPEHAEQMKQDSANAEARKSRHNGQV
jgi:hypothetical protein